MNLVRWNPFRDLSYLEHQMNRLFDATPDTLADSTLLNGWFPLSDICETENDFVVTAELPGIDPKAVEVLVENDVLIIRGERRLEENYKKEDYHHIERSYGAFSRAFTLPARIDPEKIHAEFKDGVLSIMLPKAEEAKSKKIMIEAAA